MACFLWGYPVTQILGGYLADRFGAERVIITGMCRQSYHSQVLLLHNMAMRASTYRIHCFLQLASCGQV